MLKVGDKIRIRYSNDLVRRGSGNVINKTGIVTYVLKSNGVLLGVWADVKTLKKMRNYFIPAKSIETEKDVDQARTLSILKTTIL